MKEQKNLLVPVEVPARSGRGWCVVYRGPSWLRRVQDGKSRPPARSLSAVLPEVPAGVGGCSREHDGSRASGEAANQLKSFTVRHAAAEQAE